MARAAFPVIERIVFQHAEDVAFLWSTRERAARSDAGAFADLVRLDARLEANLEGLRAAGNACESMLEQLVAAGDTGAWFGRAVLAIESRRHERLVELVERASGDEDVREALASALAWVDADHLSRTVKALLDSASPVSLDLGLRCCAAHGRHPGAVLARAARHDATPVRARAWRVAADLGDVALLPVCSAIATVDDPHERFERLRARALLGDPDGARAGLEAMALGEEEAWRSESVELFALSSRSTSVRALLKTLSAREGRTRDVVTGFAVAGDPVALGWLLDRCDDPALARHAGRAIVTITGVDLEETGLIAADDAAEDDLTAPEMDEDLPRPDPARLRVWWRDHPLPFGVPHLAGRPRDAAALADVHATGVQAHRRLAALSSALARAERPYHDPSLPSARQREWRAEPERGWAPRIASRA